MTGAAARRGRTHPAGRPAPALSAFGIRSRQCRRSRVDRLVKRLRRLGARSREDLAMGCEQGWNAPVDQIEETPRALFA